jgi:hypothetical protein
MGEMQGGVLGYGDRNAVRTPDGWEGSKVLWMVKPNVNGKVLVRGRRIDGPEVIGFGLNDNPDFQLVWDTGPHTEWTGHPSEIRIQAAGCYAFQVDWSKGTEVIVFKVV